MVFGEDCIVKRGNFIEDTFSHRAMASMRQDLRLWATTFRMHTLLVGGSDTVVVRHMRGAKYLRDDQHARMKYATHKFGDVADETLPCASPNFYD